MHAILDLSAPDPRPWTLVNDDVMGGRSTSRVRRTEQGTLRFSGHLSLANSGGFASTRTPLDSLDLASFQGVALRIRGDGRRYQLRLWMASRDRIAYGAELHTIAGAWTEVRVPFTAFQPTFRGRRPADAPALDPGALGRLGFLIADRREGPFELEVAWVRAYREGRGQGDRSPS